jgi:hypothetical protein
LFQLALPALVQPDLRQGIADCVQVFFEVCRADADILHVLYVGLGFGKLQDIEQHAPQEDAEVVAGYLKVLTDRMARGEIRRYDDPPSLFCFSPACSTGLRSTASARARSKRRH